VGRKRQKVTFVNRTTFKKGYHNIQDKLTTFKTYKNKLEFSGISGQVEGLTYIIMNNNNK